MRLVYFVTGALFALSLTLLLVTSNLRFIINDVGFYENGFEKYGVSQSTALEPSQLRKAAQALVHYFNSPEETVKINVLWKGEVRELFNQREVVHLNDVKGLVVGVYWVQALALLYLVGYAGVGFWRGGVAFGGRLARRVLEGGLLALGLLTALGMGMLFAFDALFLQFHLLSFSNPFWQLDPARDYLIRMFPEGFFYDAALATAGATVVEALLLLALSGGYLFWAKRKAPETRGLGSEEKAIPRS